MYKSTLYLFLSLYGITIQAQQFEVVSGAIEAISGIERYNVVFTYAQDLKISDRVSEQSYLQKEVKKRERQETGAGEKFKTLWFENRVNQYEPTFIQRFNNFSIAKRQVTSAKNITSTPYTMEVKTISIACGYDDFFYVEEGTVGLLISIYKTDTPENVLYAIKIKARGLANADEFERIRSAYGNLGEAATKHFNRKGLVKN